MPMWSRFADWPVRAGIAAILVVASSVPLIIAAAVDLREAKSQLLDATADLLAARGDQLVRELDTFNRGYQRTVDEVAHSPTISEFLQHSDGQRNAKRGHDGRRLAHYKVAQVVSNRYRHKIIQCDVKNRVRACAPR